MLIVLFGCISKENDDPNVPSVVIVDEQYDYSVESKFYSRPAVINHIKWFDALKATTEDGTFICLTQDTTQADNFINTQRTLLHFLKDCGMDLRNLRYIVSDHEDSFSDSGKDTAYIAFSSKKTYRQVLATLHTLWGDYTDYGYMYAMANVIAEQLGWQTNSKIDIEPAVMKEFFSNNPKAIDLQYPCFSSEFASEETVNQCKALSIHLFDDIQWVTALEKPIDIQLDEYYELVEVYAREIGIPFARQSCAMRIAENICRYVLTLPMPNSLWIVTIRIIPALYMGTIFLIMNLYIKLQILSTTKSPKQLNFSD